jgi:dihydroflavonol-4-reductase
MASFKKIVITGGCGFLGQHLLSLLAKEFPETSLVVLDLKKPANFLYPFENFSQIEFHIGQDITDVNAAWVDLLAGADLVINLVGLISFSDKDKNILEKVNIEGTKNVLAAAVKAGIKSFIHVSSVAALGYNNDEKNPADENLIFDWSQAEKKKKYYMLTKHLGDLEVKKAIGIKTLILRPGLMLGPGDNITGPKLLTAIKAEKMLTNTPGGTNVVDARDVARGIVLTLKNNILEGDFLLAGYNLTFQEINSAMASAIGAQAPQKTMPKFLHAPLYNCFSLLEKVYPGKLPLTSDNIDSSFMFRYFSNAKAEKTFGWTPQISFGQTCGDAWQWLNEKK